MEKHWKPTREQIQAARKKTVPDVIASDLRVLFCGINPGLYTAAVGHHFARPGNRFWPALHHAGFTKTQLSPFDEKELLKSGIGITNFVARATASANELSQEELRRGGESLKQKIREYRPKALAVLGIGAYRKAFGDRYAKPGRQFEKLEDSELWVIPNPSGLNANYRLGDIVRILGELKKGL